MGIEPKPLSANQEQAIYEYPCDGVPRFAVKLKRSTPSERGLVTYSAAYEGVFLSTGGTRNEKGGRCFTQRGLKKIAALNRSYLANPDAQQFVVTAMTIQNGIRAKQIEAVEKIPIPEKKPESEPDHDPQAEPAKLQGG